ncbi:Elongation factor P [Candidatus Ecksteinia adelgidicola]|nr:Elongation factor P [Candidatus Ecksteinia adelgidicola]
MITYFSKSFRPGLKIIFENEPYSIENSEFVKSGKGQSFVRVKMRRLLNGARIEKTFKSTESLKIANVIDVNMNYLYSDANFCYFMKSKTFEQFQIEKTIISESIKWLQNNIECIITLWNSRPILIQLPNFIEAKVIDINPEFKHDVINTSYKSVLLNTGAILKVPLFIQIGEVIRVDTRSGCYISRVNDLFK